MSSYNAQDLVVLQRELGVLAKYVVDMGAEIELFEIAERIPPWENPRPLSMDDLRRLRVSTVDDPFAVPAKAEASALAAAGAPARSLDVVDRAWIASEKPDQHSFSRRHPLTIEGEQIGAFELTFLCAPDGEVAVAYNESRHLREGTNDRLSAVAIGSGKEHVLLNIQSSAPDLAGSELLSMARNSVPPALLNALAESEGRPGRRHADAGQYPHHDPPGQCRVCRESSAHHRGLQEVIAETIYSAACAPRLASIWSMAETTASNVSMVEAWRAL